MTRLVQIALVFALLSLTAVSALAATTLVVPAQAPFAKDLEVPAAVRDECQLPIKLSDFVREYAADDFQVKTDATGAKDAMVLKMEITEIEGRGGGAWSGTKFVGAKGTLTQNGKVIGDFRAKRYSGGGAFGGYKGTCSILGRCVKAMGKDIALWAKHPIEGARLGDL